MPQIVMSALPPKADMCSATGDVGYGPIADIPPLLDNFGRAPDYRVGDDDTERICGLSG
jgi:hypothetical protein